jgi:hypothetical protein
MPGLITFAVIAVAQTGMFLSGHESTSEQRRIWQPPPEVRTGATVGAVTGLAAGIVIYATKDCEGLQCGAKTMALPLVIFAYTAAGGLAGAGVGFVVHSLKPAYHDDARFRSHATQLGIGLAVSF